MSKFFSFLRSAWERFKGNEVASDAPRRVPLASDIAGDEGLGPIQISKLIQQSGRVSESAGMGYGGPGAEARRLKERGQLEIANRASPF